MTYAGSSAAGAQQAAMVSAVRAMGAIVKLKPEEFRKILHNTENPAVVTAVTRFLGVSYKYLVSYKGLIFYTKSKTELELPSGTELIYADRIWFPGE
jgi:hypothetical protein